MKLLLFVFALIAFVASSMALKNTICGQPSSFNPSRCWALLLRWSYNPSKNICVEFTYGGCGSNANNFGSFKDCIDTCVE